jgi:glycerate kinase
VRPEDAPVLVAPDKFKGTLSAAEVAAAVAEGVRAAGSEAVELPVADGGEGTMDALLATGGGELREARVQDALGRPVEARFALLDDGTAAVDAAQASGLWRLDNSELDAMAASTYGAGELIAAAVEAGAKHVIVAPGGSATTDGGAGALKALQDAGIDNVKLTVACDVRTVWEDAAKVFGPQKGADPETVMRLERRLAGLARKAPRDPRGVPLTGCGGGLSGGLWAHLNADLVPGAALVLDSVGFDAHMKASRFVVTGEGKLDDQTLQGKTVGEVATRCRQSGVWCHALVGQDDLDEFLKRVLDFASVHEAGTPKALAEAGRALVTGR